MALPEETQQIFITVWELDQREPNEDLYPCDFGRPDLDEEYLSGHNWATINDIPVFFD